MSSSLIWEPANSKKPSLDSSVKMSMRKLYGEPVDCVLSEKDLSFLRGALAAGADIQKVIDLIMEHGYVKFREEY